MNINTAISLSTSERPCNIEQEKFLLWLSTLDNKVRLEIFGEKHENVTSYTEEDIKNDTVLLIPMPYDSCYLHYLSAMIDISYSEWDRYSNDYALFNASFEDYAKFCKREGLVSKKVHRFYGF